MAHVDGVSLGSLEGIEQVLTELPTASAWSVTVWHATGSGWSSVDYSIARGP